MSNIDAESLVFAMPENDSPDSRMITCQMPVDMIMNWMQVVYPHVDKYRRVQGHYANIAAKCNIDPEDYDAIIDYVNSQGMKDDLQALMMEVIVDLSETMGTKDFFELYTMKVTAEDEAYLATQNWVGLDPNGDTFKASMDVDSVETD